MNPPDEELPWPNKGDKLFGLTGHPHFQATIANHADLIVHIEGFRRSADLIFDHIDQNPREIYSGFLIFPAAYLCRHFIELSLKDIIALSRYIDGGRESYPTGHNLDKLWREARTLLEKIGPGCRDEDFEAMGSLIGELSAIDPGDAFRYPTDPKGNPNLAALSTFNLHQFRGGIEKMSGFLDGARAMLADYKSHKDSIY